MTDPITVVLLGNPVPFARMRTGGGHHFIPDKQRNYSAALRLAAHQEMLHSNMMIFVEPVCVSLRAEMAIPASWSKKKQQAALLGEVRPAGKPDIDNIYKLVADAFNSVVWRDDALVVDVQMRKVYSMQPKIVVTVAPVAVT